MSHTRWAGEWLVWGIAQKTVEAVFDAPLRTHYQIRERGSRVVALRCRCMFNKKGRLAGRAAKGRKRAK